MAAGWWHVASVIGVSLNVSCWWSSFDCAIGSTVIYFWLIILIDSYRHLSQFSLLHVIANIFIPCRKVVQILLMLLISQCRPRLSRRLLLLYRRILILHHLLRRLLYRGHIIHNPLRRIPNSLLPRYRIILKRRIIKPSILTYALLLILLISIKRAPLCCIPHRRNIFAYF